MESHFADIEFHIIKYIRKAENRLLAAIAWFTNVNIAKELVAKKNINIEIIVDDNDINRNSQSILLLQQNHIDVTFVKDLSKKYYLMHNKFCIIDNEIVMTGSYNWTKNANSNDENISINRDRINAALYNHEFRRIKTIDLKNTTISLSETEMENITYAVYQKLKTLLKQNIDYLETNLIYDWSDENIKNLIRNSEERIRNTLQDQVGSLGKYQDLIYKYGIEYLSYATEEEKIISRDKFKKKDLEEIDKYTNEEFQLFKLKAIKRLLFEYSNLLKDNIDKEKSEKILSIVKFITSEKSKIGYQINRSFV